MGSDIDIYRISYKNNGNTLVFDRIWENHMTQEQKDEICDACGWKLEGECGFMGEITGEELNEILKTNKFTELEDWYRVSINW